MKGEDRMLQYLAAFVILGHGIGHITGPLSAFGVKIGGTSDKPWIMPGGHKMTSTVGKAWSVFWIAALILFVISSVGAFISEAWWRDWAIPGAVVSIVAMVPWWNSILIGAKAGVILDIAILLVLLFSWGEGIMDFFELP
jgi:hypothetical protein